MKTTILIAPNSFKECVSSVNAAVLIRKSLEKYIPEIELIMKPISDGGDGFLEVCRFYFGGEIIHYDITTPYDDSLFECPVLYNADYNKIYIESADVLGLKIVPQKFRKPMHLSSKGMGELLLKINEDVKKRKIIVDNIMVGIGGTATIDMGLGMCSRLGLKLIDKHGSGIDPITDNFYDLQAIKMDRIELPFKLNCVIDVNNPLLGKSGAAFSFGRQKGASENEILSIDNLFGKVINILKNSSLVDSSTKLSGAGGGLAAGFQIMFSSRMISSEEFIMDDLNLHQEIESADYLITGEGVFDSQSFMGKGAGTLVRHALAKNKEVFLVCGRYLFAEKFNENVKVFELQELFDSEEESIKKFYEGIDKVCEKIALSVK